VTALIVWVERFPLAVIKLLAFNVVVEIPPVMTEIPEPPTLTPLEAVISPVDKRVVVVIPPAMTEIPEPPTLTPLDAVISPVDNSVLVLIPPVALINILAFNRVV
jgi:hypothetical protein